MLFLMLSIVFSLLVLHLAYTTHIRHQPINGQMMQARFIELPGWKYWYYPENTVSAEPWLGSQINKIDILVDNQKNPEIEALMTLKAIGAYSSDYQLKKQDEHWVLYRAPRKEKYFSFCAPYRVSSWKTCPTPS